MGDVIKDFYKSDAPQFKGRSKEKRREMAIAAKLTAERGPQNEAATEVAMSPDELALQKRKTRIDKMITMKRQQALQKAEVKADVKEATYPSDFRNPDGSKRAVAKKKYGRPQPQQHDQKTDKYGRRKTVDESSEDSLRDRRMERGGVDGNTRYNRPPAKKASNAELGIKPGKTVLQKEMEKKHGKGASAMDIVKAEIRAKHGKGAIMNTKKK